MRYSNPPFLLKTLCLGPLSTVYNIFETFFDFVIIFDLKVQNVCVRVL